MTQPLPRPERAVILAAGRGSRLGAAAGGTPKPLVPVAGVPLLWRALDSLAAAGVRQAVVVIGHRGDEIITSVSEWLRCGPSAGQLEISFVASDEYSTTNNIYSLWLARDHLHGDMFVLDGDTAFDAELLLALSETSGDAVAGVVPYTPGMTGTVVGVDGDGRVGRILDVRAEIPTDGSLYKTVSIFLLRARLLRESFVPALERLIQAGRTAAFWEAVLTELVDRGWRGLKVADCTRFRWCEVDDLSDWMQAELSFASDDERFGLIEREYGRYQRSGAADHLVMTNIYFPTEAVLSEIRRELDSLITDYPSAQATLARFLAAAIDQPAQRLVVANGASELIRVLCGSVTGPLIVPVPTFNEYEQATPSHHLVRFALEPPSFELDVERLADTAREIGAELVVVVSPNNPTSLVVPADALRWLSDSLARGGCRLLLDESLVDFCPRPASQSLAGEIGERSNLAIVKSLSMCCGVPGIRLGYLVTADSRLWERVRRELPIWNVNAVAEAFLRLLPRFKAELANACARMRSDCDDLCAMLGELPGVVTYPSSASFCFARLPDETGAIDVARRLFAEHGMLTKSCSGKSMPAGQSYLRIKSRTRAENRRFVSALSAVLADVERDAAAMAQQ